MDISRFKYLVNPYSLEGLRRLIESDDMVRGDIVSFSFDRNPELFSLLHEMMTSSDTLVTFPGYVFLYVIRRIDQRDGRIHIDLKNTNYRASSAIISELIKVHCADDYYKSKVSAERNDDGSVTFSVPTVQGLRIREDAVPVFVSHGDEPGERGEPGGVDNILVLTDKVDVLSESPFRHYSKEIELKCNDKFGAFLEYWQSLPVPRKILFRMEKDSQDVYKVESLRYECGRGFITAQYIGNMCNFKRVDAMFAQNTWIDTMDNLCSELEKKNSGHKKEHSELREELLKRYTNRPTPLEDFCDALAVSANNKPKLDVVVSAPTTRRINSVKLNKVTRL